MAFLTDSSLFLCQVPVGLAPASILPDHFVCLLDRAGNVTGWSADAERISGYRAADILGRPFSDLFPSDQGGTGLPSQAQEAAWDRGRGERTGVVGRKDGSRFRAHVVVHAFTDDPGEPTAGAVALIRDLTVRKLPTGAHCPVDTTLDIILRKMSEGVALFGTDRGLVYCNARFGAILGLPEDCLRHGTSCDQVLADVVGVPGNGGEALAVHQDRAPGPEGLRDWTIETRRLDRSVLLSCFALPDGRHVVTCDDMTPRRQAEGRATYLEQHDTVTALANLHGLQRHLNLHCARPESRFSVFYFDLFGFKRVNNTMGHAAGDELLRIAAGRVRAILGQSDLGAHIRGNKFAIVVHSAQDEAGIHALAHRLRTALTRPIAVLGHEVTVGVGIGIVRFPMDGADRDTLMWNADIALQHAKDGDASRIRFYDPDMDTARRLRMDLERDLRLALERDEFILHYQPFLNLQTNRIIGFEALIRWRHPTRGLVAPGDFIPVAESMGLMYDIGVWTLDAACREAVGWPADTVISVNVSAAQFRHGGLVETVKLALACSGLDATRLELEITETAMIDDVPHAGRVLRQMRDMGVQIALDDFGTGYSSLSFLHSLPFTRIKIDRSFIRDMGNGMGDGGAIVRAITGLCGSLGVVATAEGVETQEQFDYLKQVKCSEIQGFFFSRPCPAAEARKLLEVRQD
ncbi:EAL domain-containing protein [Gluconacetobacter tumulisoli]|uniref:EAL domain-containing protein n=2 Tax=Gluconacetobacter tumulisoli TaxID=1286189 RepID=A0A7W4K7Y1_9PROT|nr:EAL domain-containing protein [Gluconacetobacter tumulisoli]